MPFNHYMTSYQHVLLHYWYCYVITTTVQLLFIIVNIGTIPLPRAFAILVLKTTGPLYGQHGAVRTLSGVDMERSGRPDSGARGSCASTGSFFPPFILQTRIRCFRHADVLRIRETTVSRGSVLRRVGEASR